MPQSLDNFINDSPARVLPALYALVKSAQPPRDMANFFMVATDPEETTIIVRESEIPDVDVLGVERGYRLIEFRPAIPFQGVGFLAAISRAIADAGLNILVVLTFSKDYILLKDATLPHALDALANACFQIVNDSAS